MPTAFISYSWESPEHKTWVKNLAARLRSDGIETILDQWNLKLGDQLTEFMERSIRENDYVLVICTPKYKIKSDNRTGGVGYEGDIITSEIFSYRNNKKFIPIHREGEWKEAAPISFLGKYYVDFKGNPYPEDSYRDLLATIQNKGTSIPPIINKSPTIQPKAAATKIKDATVNVYEDIRIEGIIVDKVSIPRMDGSRGSALYMIPFKLSRKPSSTWVEYFIDSWDNPSSYTSMHRPGIARIESMSIILDGTTMDEVKKYHRDTLKLAVKTANEKEKLAIQRDLIHQKLVNIEIEKHTEEVNNIAKTINFD